VSLNAAPSLWFGQRGTNDDYVPLVFEPCGAKTYAVNNHPFWLDLSVRRQKGPDRIPEDDLGSTVRQRVTT
jgi:hypothetical protein